MHLKMAVQAVISELVSARLFPVLRENTAKFADFRLQTKNDPRRSTTDSITWDHDSIAAKTGKLSSPSGQLGTLVTLAVLLPARLRVGSNPGLGFVQERTRWELRRAV
jgi:hypothetical protein